MTALLVILTLASIAAAAVCGFAAWRLSAAERERANARVAALADAIDALDRPVLESRTPTGVDTLFAPQHSDVARGWPMIRIAVGLAMAGILLMVLAISQRNPAGAPQAAAAVRPAAARGTAPLELITMRHERKDDTLVISGMVRNPRAGARVSRVTAVVVALNGTGQPVANAHAPLDFTALDPGEESPFVVNLGGAGRVSRYRVSFRTEAGVMQHVDRRGQQSRLAAAVIE
jgi:hypothetical protein